MKTIFVIFDHIKMVRDILSAAPKLKAVNARLMTAGKPSIQVRRQFEPIKTRQLSYLNYLKMMFCKLPGNTNKKKRMEFKIDSGAVQPNYYDCWE